MLTVKQTTTYARWITRLKDKRAKALIVERVFRLANGQAGDAKNVGQGVRELRVHHGPGYRIYFTQRGSELIVLLCGGDKDSQNRDIALARRLAQEVSNE